MATRVNGATRTVTKTFMVKGQRKRVKVTLYDKLDEAVHELGSLRVLKDINEIIVQRARWVVASRASSPRPEKPGGSGQSCVILMRVLCPAYHPLPATLTRMRYKPVRAVM